MVFRSNTLVKVSLVDVGSPREPVARAMPANKILIELAIDAETRSNPCSVAIRNTALKVTFTADPYVSVEPKAACKSLERTYLRRIVLRLRSRQAEFRFYLDSTGGRLAGQPSRFRCRLLRLAGCTLGLVRTALDFLCGVVGLLRRVEYLLKLRP